MVEVEYVSIRINKILKQNVRINNLRNLRYNFINNKYLNIAQIIKYIIYKQISIVHCSAWPMYGY